MCSMKGAVAATVDNAANMDVAVKKLQIVKFPCFAHTLNLGAQKLYNCNARIRSVIVWMKRSHMAKVVLKEKQDLLKLPKHMLLLDVKIRWNSLYLMMERFCEQFPAIQPAAIDTQIRKPMEKEKLDKMGNEDLRKAEEFVLLMRKHYTSTLAVSSDKSPTCGEILPILQKLQKHYTVQEDDYAFTRSIKENIWNDLSKRYQLPEQGETQREGCEEEEEEGGEEEEEEEEEDYRPDPVQDGMSCVIITISITTVFTIISIVNFTCNTFTFSITWLQEIAQDTGDLDDMVDRAWHQLNPTPVDPPTLDKDPKSIFRDVACSG
ncbi:hypothetical protein ABVT39_010547 [Epinephelus coioides]